MPCGMLYQKNATQYFANARRSSMVDVWAVCSVMYFRGNTSQTSACIITVMPHQRYGVSEYRHLDFFFNGLSDLHYKLSKLRVTGPLWGESTGHRWIPSRRATYAETVSMLWCLHAVPSRYSRCKSRDKADICCLFRRQRGHSGSSSRR